MFQVEDLALEKIATADDYPVVVHGTYYRCLASIKQQGLRWICLLNYAPYYLDCVRIFPSKLLGVLEEI